MTPRALGKRDCGHEGHTPEQVWSGFPSPKQAFFGGVTGLSPCRGAEQTLVNNGRSHPSAERGEMCGESPAALIGLVLRQPGSDGV